jgi:hypothetical protein
MSVASSVIAASHVCFELKVIDRHSEPWANWRYRWRLFDACQHAPRRAHSPVDDGRHRTAKGSAIRRFSFNQPSSLGSIYGVYYAFA